MKKTYIYLALGAVAAWWFIKRKKAQATAEERTLVLLEFGTKKGDVTPYRLTYSDNTTEKGLAIDGKVIVLMQLAKQDGAEIRTGVEGIKVKPARPEIDGGTVVKPKA